MPITKATLDANPNHAAKGKRVTFVCAYEHCDNVFERVPSRLKYGCKEPCCSKSCAAKHGKRLPPLCDPLEQSERMKARYAADPTTNPFFGRTPVNYRGFGHGGFVEELGFKVRSSWEREYLLALHKSGIPFEYEPERFVFRDYTYLPDVLITGTNFYIEIKGWDRFSSKWKRRLFLLNYDVRLHVVSVPPTKRSMDALVRVCEGVMP